MGRSDRVGSYGLPAREGHRRRSIVETLRLAVCVLDNLLFYDLDVLDIEYGEAAQRLCAKISDALMPGSTSCFCCLRTNSEHVQLCQLYGGGWARRPV